MSETPFPLSTARELGRHGAEIDAMRREMTTMNASINALSGDVKHLIATMNEAKGGWRALLMVGSLAGLIGATATKIWAFIKT